MTLLVYNTLRGDKEPLEVPANNRINFFVCGPTVYDYSHLGHARTYIAFDVIVRYLRFKGHSVFYLMNVTDIDDKMIARANEREISVKALADENFGFFLEDMATLGMTSVNYYGKATEHVEAIIEQIETLIENGCAYEKEGNVYFSVRTVEHFGELSGQKLDELQAGMRVTDPNKRDAMDFALWKAEKPGEPSWDSPWGRGRPGWHVEDTAITNTYFGPQYDIHGGARDLIFPHHEAEIAIAEAYSGRRPFVKYWFHTGFLNVRGEKMSKSLGNFFTIREILERYTPEVIRFYLTNTHYRKPIDFDDGRLEESKQSYQRLMNTYTLLAAARASADEAAEAVKAEEADENTGNGAHTAFATAVKDARDGFFAAMDNDFNTRDAIAELFTLATAANSYLSPTGETVAATADPALVSQALDIFNTAGAILGLFGVDAAGTTGAGAGAAGSAGGTERVETALDNVITLLLRDRAAARERKDWSTADRIRDELNAAGIELEDGAGRTTWKLSDE